MTVTNISDCFEKGLLRRSRVDKERASGSLNIADKFLNEAKGNIKMGYCDAAFLLAYNSMFHTARTLVFLDGITERSHFCMITYLLEKFRANTTIHPYLEILDTYRIVRHKIQYSGEQCAAADAQEIVDDAIGFLKAVKDLFGNY
ncbi:MAG: HEPN domain-containing protein [Euryarchaeota archaeon]|nr:HEPN domain-containing protein [Euryarchaeota archaeon]MBU4491403.1 HEPN domain-containing protein [Euryarchaeota archaeon]MCG2727485.1 HEPN domain-containing protein [Candidatus Methanoperedenaceae archaeon]